MSLRLDPRMAMLSLVVGGAIFAFDLAFASYFATSVAYVGLVLVCRGSPFPPLAYWLAAIATALIAIGYFASSAEGSLTDLANRGLALAATWLTALLCAGRLGVARDLAAARAELEQQKDRASTTATRAVRALRSERDDRERIEEELEETEQRYRAVFNQTFQFTAVLSPSGSVDEVNETMRGLGLPQAAGIAGTPVWQLPIWDDGERDRLRRAVEAAATGDFISDEISMRRSGGERIIVDLSLKPIRDPEGQVDLIILEARDITQHKRDQALLIQTQKLEVLGQFASGIAHDFNNLLTVIAGNLELVERRVKGDDAVSNRIAKAVNAVFQGRALTDRILAFARRQQLEPRPVEVKSLIAEAIGLSKSGLDEMTDISSEIAPDLWSCWADPSQLQTALLNLLINARDAMPGGGRVEVRAANVTLAPEPRLDRVDLPHGDYVVLSVTDQGEGIPARLLEKVTEPFFTTKLAGRGSGLGLSMVAGFTQQSGGDLRIESTEGRGTTVSLYLPRSHEAASMPRRKSRAPAVQSDA